LLAAIRVARPCRFDRGAVLVRPASLRPTLSFIGDADAHRSCIASVAVGNAVATAHGIIDIGTGLGPFHTRSCSFAVADPFRTEEGGPAVVIVETDIRAARAG
jgi:hypothetical protein